MYEFLRQLDDEQMRLIIWVPVMVLGFCSTLVGWVIIPRYYEDIGKYGVPEYRFKDGGPKFIPFLYRILFFIIGVLMIFGACGVVFFYFAYETLNR